MAVFFVKGNENTYPKGKSTLAYVQSKCPCNRNGELSVKQDVFVLFWRRVLLLKLYTAVITMEV